MKRPTPLKVAVIRSGRQQREIAESLGIPETTFSRIVNGLHADDATRKRIVRELRTTVPDVTLETLWPEQAAA